MLVVWDNGEPSDLRRIVLLDDSLTIIEPLANFIKLARPRSRIVCHVVLGDVVWRGNGKATTVVEWLDDSLMGAWFEDEEKAIAEIQGMSNEARDLVDACNYYDISAFIREAKRRRQ
jgi:hypothetical protein